MRKPKLAADLLFEIGTEELPAAYLPGLITRLGEEARRLFTLHALRFRTLETFGTPRRLVLIVRRLEATQRKPAEEVRGPSKQAAFDQQGKPTPALLGFLRARGGTLRQTNIVPSPKGGYVYLTKAPTQVPTAQVLPQVLTQLVGGLGAPKTMRWDDSGVRFARPIRWILACYGTRPIRCPMAGLASSDRTCIGLPKHPRAIRVRSTAGYVGLLKRAGILVDHRQRAQQIERLIERLAKPQRGRPAPEMTRHGLLEEVTFLVEQPRALLGAFEAKYLRLPREVLLASMAKYQRVFALEAAAPKRARAQGGLLAKFVAILDGSPRQSARIRRIIEHILNARLADSLLFWNEDHRHLPLEQMASRLHGVSFHEQLGSMADKALRLEALSEPLAEAWQLTHDEQQHLRRACQLAKADLVSAMVREFPTLQGVIGTYYAADSGEPRPVAEAIGEQYLPARAEQREAGGPAGGQLPTTLLGKALALLDKFDTLVSYFSLGIEPTGDQDPFGLRRAAQGIVEVAWAAQRPLPLDHLCRKSHSMEPLRRAPPERVAVTSTRVQRYLLERLYTFGWPGPAPSADYIDAVLGSPCPDLVDAMVRIRSLQELDGRSGLLKAAKVVERTRNILKGATLHQAQVDPARLQEPLERQLWDLYRSHEPQVARLSEGRSYAKATTLFGEVFFTPLHEFFARVLVNVPDQALQQNRLALMRLINTLYTDRIADLSKLSILQREGSP